MSDHQRATAAGDDPELERILDAYRLIQVHHSRVVAVESAARGLNLTDMRLLFFLEASVDGVVPKEATEYLRITTGAMTNLLDRLESHGYIERTPNPNDRRSVIARVTHEGAATVRSVKDIFREAFRDAIPAAQFEAAATMFEALDAAIAAKGAPA